MKISGHTEESVREALAKANLQYDGNLTFKQLERHGSSGRSKYLDVKITVKASRDSDGEILPGVHTTRAHYTHYSDHTRHGVRANRSASWDAHGTFFLWLYRLNPDTVIRSGAIAYGSVVLKSRQDLANHWR